LRPSLRRDRTLLRNTTAALDDPTYGPARALIRAIGADALAALRRAARDEHHPRLQKRAARLVQEIVHASHPAGHR
jgi:hypothetical protein